ncbi:hypothetical protein GCM10027614_06840 [Micromonospora vulcania]
MYRSLSAHKSLVLLLDNAQDVAQVRPLLPNSAQSLVLITGRAPLVGLAAHDGAYLLHLDVPDLADARLLLEKRLPTLPPDARNELVEEIIARCGRLPLALAIVSARVEARPQVTPAAIAAELAQSENLLEALHGGRSGSDPRTAFAWSYRQLSPGAARLFRLSSVTLSPHVSATACASLLGLDPQPTRELLRELEEAALVQECGDARYRSPVLVRSYARELCLDTDSEQERNDATSRLLQHYLHSSFNAQVVLVPHRIPIAPPPPMPGVHPEKPGSYDEAMAWFGAEREVLGDAVRRAAETEHGIVPWHLALTMQQYLQWAGFFYQWVEVMRLALGAARRAGDRLGEAHVLRSLAGARFSFAAYEEARNLLLAAQEIFVAHGCVLEQGFVHTNLGDVLIRMGQYESALREHREALARYRAVGYHRAEVRALSDIADVLGRRGDYEQAVHALQEAVRLNEAVGNLHEGGRVRLDAACLLVKLDRQREAVEQLERAIDSAQSVGQKPIHSRRCSNWRRSG